MLCSYVFFFCTVPATPAIYTYCHTLPLHAPLPSCDPAARVQPAMFGPDARIVEACRDRMRLVGCYFEPAGETPARDAVEDREIDRLGARAGVAVNQIGRAHV